MTARHTATVLLAAKLHVAAKRDRNAVHRAADAHLNAMTLAIHYAFLRGRRAYASGGVSAATSAIRAALRTSLPPTLLKVVAAGGAAGVKQLPRARHAMRTLDDNVFFMAFDVDSPEAIAWATDHASKIADDISETSKENINAAIASALAGDGLDAAYDDILDAVGDSDRAAMIARTEVMDAANEGLAQSWDQATDAGLLTGREKKQWIATSDACDDCADVDGEEVDLDDDFSVGDDPPLHPNCRCTMGLADGGDA